MPKTPCSAAAPSRRHAPRRSAAGVLLPALLPALGLLGLIACGADNPTRPPDPPEAGELYWRLALNHAAVTLATGASYNTLQLTAVPLTSTGAVLANLSTPRYVSQDAAKVVVTPDGVLHAVKATAQPVLVIATLTVGNLTHADSVWVRVVDTADPPVLAAFTLQPGVDSAKVGMDVRGAIPLGMPPLRVQAADGQGQPMNDLLVAFRSSDELIATIDPTTGQIAGKWPGLVTFYASATVFGVSKTDSVRYRIGAPIYQSLISPTSSSDGGPIPDFPTITIGVGGAVTWLSSYITPFSFSLEFEDAALPNLAPGTSFSEFDRSFVFSFFCQFLDCNGAGNVVVTAPSQYGAFRVFTAPGVYDYRCPECGNGGRVIVVDETQS